MRHWFKDQHFRSLLKNSSYLGVSQGVAAICGVATLAFAGRGLGVLMFGTLILITSYVKAVSGIAKFQSWQLIVRYGGHGVAHGDPEHFKVATGFAFALDMVSGIGGLLVGAALLPFIGEWVGIGQQYLWLGMLYCTVLPIMASATPDGVLRVLDRFDLISWSGTLSPIVRAILAGIAFVDARAVSGLCRDLVRHRRHRQPLSLVSRVARAPAQRPARRHPADTQAHRASRRLAFRHRRQPCEQRAGRLGPDRSPGRGRIARACGGGVVPGRLNLGRQRSKASRLAGQGLLSRSDANGPDVQAAVEADVAWDGRWSARSPCSLFSSCSSAESR